MYIFKQNIKVLLGCIVEQLWSKNMTSDHLDSILAKEINKGSVTEIKEVDEEYQVTDSMFGSSMVQVK